MQALIRVAREAAWAPALVLVLHSLLGAVYGHEPYIDPAMHFAGGAAAAFFFRRAAVICRTWLGPLTPLGLDVLAFSTACSMALAWELAEFLVDRLLDTQRQGGLPITMRDLFLGVAGASVLVAAARILAPDRPITHGP